MTNDNKISSLGTRQDMLLDQVSRKENSRWCMKYLTGSSETTYQCLFIHIWRIYRSLACNPSAIINTRMFYPTSKVMSSNDSTSKIILIPMFSGRWWMSRLKGTQYTPCFSAIMAGQLDLNYQLLFYFHSGRRYITNDINCQLEPWSQTERVLTTSQQEVVIPRGSHDDINLDKLLPEIIFKGMQFRCKYNNHGISE